MLPILRFIGTSGIDWGSSKTLLDRKDSSILMVAKHKKSILCFENIQIPYHFHKYTIFLLKKISKHQKMKY